MNTEGVARGGGAESENDAYVSIRQHTSAYPRQHTSAYVSIRHLRAERGGGAESGSDPLRERRASPNREKIERKAPTGSSAGVSICAFALVKQVNQVPASAE